MSATSAALLEAPVRSRKRAMCFFTVPSDTPA
jgi:hypothetical protein